MYRENTYVGVESSAEVPAPLQILTDDELAACAGGDKGTVPGGGGNPCSNIPGRSPGEHC